MFRVLNYQENGHKEKRQDEGPKIWFCHQEDRREQENG